MTTFGRFLRVTFLTSGSSFSSAVHELFTKEHAMPSQYTSSHISQYTSSHISQYTSSHILLQNFKNYIRHLVITCRREVYFIAPVLAMLWKLHFPCKVY